jgi:hypothetical protein
MEAAIDTQNNGLTTRLQTGIALAFTTHPIPESSWLMKDFHNVALCLLQLIGLKNGQGCGVGVRSNVWGMPKT